MKKRGKSCQEIRKYCGIIEEVEAFFPHIHIKLNDTRMACSKSKLTRRLICIQFSVCFNLGIVRANVV
jgi:hypothetical protein